MKKISLFCALALFGSTAFALDKAGCESLKDVKILHNEMIDAVWSESYAGKEFLVCAYLKVATHVGGDTSKASSFVCK